ncbi:hypothetical protein X975_11322, partial [Stegodyphus mimosarum]
MKMSSNLNCPYHIYFVRLEESSFFMLKWLLHPKLYGIISMRRIFQFCASTLVVR